MITDRISLNIALKSLNQFEQNEGRVVDITFSYRDNVSNNLKSTPSFDNLDVLKAYINKYAPLTTFEHEDCFPLILFELKKFTILKNESNKNMVYYGETNFISKSNNIDTFSIESLNRDYTSSMNEVRKAFDNLMISEYILQQINYIECGWLEMHSPEAMESLKQVYNKYK
jgi:exonuclease III